MKKRRFKFLRTGLKSDYNGFQWEMGEWYKTGCVTLCHGFNCSENILDALSYVKGEILAEVGVKGKHFTGADKSTWSEMRIIRAWNWTKKDSVALSIFAAELVLQNFESAYPKDDRPRKAIEAAKKYLENPLESNQPAEAAWYAAWCAAEAAWSASEAAWCAAWSASEASKAAKSAAKSAKSAAEAASEAARYAAWSAAEEDWSAAKSAKSAKSASEAARYAKSALLGKVNDWLIEHLEDMEEVCQP